MVLAAIAAVAVALLGGTLHVAEAPRRVAAATFEGNPKNHNQVLL
jgi:hypothetical protein